MRKQLTSGVHLTVVPSTQFKTTRVAVHFLTELTTANVAARTLLTSVLETASATYPTQAELSAHLEDLFGASFGIGVGKEGHLHRVSANLNLLNDQFAQEDLLARGFALLQEVLFKPLMTAGGFDSALYQREQHNLNDYLLSLTEDRQAQASLGIQKLYFADDAVQALPSFGTPELLMAVTPEKLAATYHQMMTTDQIEIVVTGAVDPETVAAHAEALGFAARPAHAGSLLVDAQPTAPRTHSEHAPVLQAKLNLAYHVACDYYGPTHYAAILANDLFGGSPQSKLFMNVREKASLAYYASSSLDPTRHLVTVQTGIDAANQQQAFDLIQAQLQAVQAGEFSATQLQVAKDGIISNRTTAFDSPRFIARQALLQALLPSQPADLATFIRGIEAVTAAQVMAAAKTFELQATYCLRGEE